jgi:hypothetical protein
MIEKKTIILFVIRTNDPVGQTVLPRSAPVAW